MASLVITYKDPRLLRPRTRNPRTHTAKQIRQIAASIQEFGFISPVLIDGTDGIIAGHGRVEAAKLIGMKDVPTVRVDHLTPAQIRAYVITDNKLAERAGWDRNLLRLELEELSVDLNFDVTVTGFEPAEIDLLVGPPQMRFLRSTIVPRQFRGQGTFGASATIYCSAGMP
jgi:ParB-like chromosome segregation protein Spo0J